MKIPRYTAGQTSNVGMMQEGISALESPEEAARAAYAPYGAAADIAATGMEVAGVIKKTADEMDNAEDKITIAVDDGYMEQALKGAKKDADERSLSDPTWTRENYEENVKAILEARREALGNLKNNKTRARALKLFDATAPMMMENARLDAINVQALKISTNWQTDYNEAVANKDYERAELLLDIGLDTEDGTKPAIVDAVKGAEARGKLAVLKKDEELTEEANRIQQIYYQDKEAGMDELRAIFDNTEMDAEERKTLESKVIGAFERANKILNIDESNRQQEFQGIADADVLDLQTNDNPEVGSPDDVVAKYNAGEYGDPKDHKSFLRVQQVLREFESRLNKDKSQEDFLTQYNSGFPMQDTQPHREQLQAYIASSTKDMSEEERGEFTLKAINQAGFITQQMRNSLKSGARSPTDMKKNIFLFRALTSGEKEFDLGLTTDEYNDYLYIDALTEFSDSPEDLDNAIEQWQQGRQRTKDSSVNTWTDIIDDGDTGEEIMAESFDKAIESGQFKEHWFWDAEDSYRNQQVTRRLRDRYMLISRKQLQLGATPDMAARSASQFIERMGTATDINGDKEIQMNLPAGAEKIKMGHLREDAIGVKGGTSGLFGGYTVIDRASTKVDHYGTVKGAIPVDQIDPDKVRLYVPMEQKDSRDDEGNVVFEIWYDGNPLSVYTEKGQMPAKISVSPTEFVSKAEREKGQRDIASEVDTAKKRLDKLIKEKALRKGQDRTSGLYIYGTQNLDEKIEKAKFAREELSRQYHAAQKANKLQ